MSWFRHICFATMRLRRHHRHNSSSLISPTSSWSFGRVSNCACSACTIGQAGFYLDSRHPLPVAPSSMAVYRMPAFLVISCALHCPVSRMSGSAHCFAKWKRRYFQIARREEKHARNSNPAYFYSLSSFPNRCRQLTAQQIIPC